MLFAGIVTVPNLRKTMWWSFLAAASLLFDVGCASRRMSPSSVATLMEHQDSVNGSRSQYVCAGAQRGWDYICEVRHYPRPTSSWTPFSQRVGLTMVMKTCDSPQCRPEFQGKPVFNLSVLPKDGPVPSREELSAWMKAQAEKASLSQAPPERPVAVFNSYLGDQKFEFAVTRTDLESTPRWSKNTPHPPFPPSASAAAARTEFATLVVNSENWTVRGITLRPTSVADAWIYVVEFSAPPSPPVGGISTTFQIVVLMDGRVVKPTSSVFKKPVPSTP